ncbi:MAG: hypothetical protein JNL42_01655 [Anaerolineae bacterium]|nr:hypothetical protein [Anaerolineae bacterium]
MNLHVKLRDGFRNDTVTMRVNGDEVYHKSGVSTRLAISYADAVDIPIEEPVVTLEVAVQGGPSETAEVRVRRTPFVEVWVQDGVMELRKSDEETPLL